MATKPTASVAQATAVERNQLRSRVLQAAFQDPSDPSNTLDLPETLDLPADDESETADDPSNTDIFRNPFDNIPRSPLTPPKNERSDEQPAAPPQAPAPQQPDAADPASPSDLGPVPGEPMRPETETEDIPSYRTNPFPQTDQGQARPRMVDPEDQRTVPETTRLIPRQRNITSCDDFRDRLSARTIDQVSLDISPPFRPDMIDEEAFERAREEFKERQEIREWRSISGAVMATGRLQDLAYGNIIIDAEHGGIEELPIDRVSEADLAYISANWGLPQECRIQQVAYEPRQWTPAEVTWKASSLCHKPLYFEEVNLERYGHTAGPFAQPVLSTAHFFVNIAVLPYKAGIHPPHECQYTLGYYRPGSCAPWIIPPIPISLRGAVTQATVVASGIAWIP